MNSIKLFLKKISFPIFISTFYFLLYLPIAILIIFSFNNATFPAPWKGFSLRWYQELFATPDIWRAFYVSLIVAICSTGLSIIMALGIVYYQLLGGKLDRLLFLFYGNIIVPEIVLAVGLLILLMFLSVPLGIPTLIIAHTVLGLGFIIPIVYARYLSLDRRIVESSLDLGATPTQTFFKVVVPSLVPAIIASGLLTFIISFDDFVLSFFCAGSDAQTLSLYIYSMIRSGVSPVVNALSTLLLFFSSFLVLIFCSLNVRTKIF